MTDRADFKVEGLSKVVRGLKQVGVEADDLKNAFGALASEAAQVEQSFVPVRSGRLRSTVRGNRAQSKAVVTAGRAAVRYAGPINYGWPKRGIRPANFQGRTDEVMRPKAIQRLEQELNRVINKEGF